MEQAIRNKLRNVVTQCRKLLEESVRLELQGRFGIYAAKKNDIQVDDDARMTHLDAAELVARKDILDHLSHITARGFNPRDGLDQLIREIAFTHLNRLCAYKMMEERKVHVDGKKFREAVSRGLKSQGFLFYLADHSGDEQLYLSGKQDVAYRKFLDWLGETLSEEIGVLFNPSDPANRIYPPQRVLDEVLALINTEELIDIWPEDETIGWVYQYFTPRELRDKARNESQTPRNSYELAFRNQFFTPRYVVEFLTDNTLGRIWYEMRKGETTLNERCSYLIWRPAEIFLKEGEEPPAESNNAREDLSQEKLLKQPVYIPHRPKKDPREIKVLDPACGSGHFLLYCFDLLAVIYEEAYNDPDIGGQLRNEYASIEDLQRAVPGLILAHNLHGIDIDLRATQIAALALWLRCQRAYQELELQNGQRPKIKRSNVVCAEPMPGETDLLKEFTATLQPKVLGQLVEVIFDKMKLASEVGSLLKIEEEIRDEALKAKFEYIASKKHEETAKGFLFPELLQQGQSGFFDFADLTDEAFLDRAEEEIVVALREYFEMTSNGGAFRRRLFADDAERGFGFVDILRKNYDVVLMNPPYGEATASSKTYTTERYPQTHKDLYASFFERAINLLIPAAGFVGALTSRTWLQNNSFAQLREIHILPLTHVVTVADLGPGVLDSAMVQTCATVLQNSLPSLPSLFFRLNKHTDKASKLRTIAQMENHQETCLVDQREFSKNPTSPMTYWLPPGMRHHLADKELSVRNYLSIKQGLATGDDFRFIRLFWEVYAGSIGKGNRWVFLSKGGTYSPWFFSVHLVVDWDQNGIAIRNLRDSRGKELSRFRGADQFFLAGLTYPFRNKGFNARALPADCIFTVQGPSVVPIKADIFLALAFLNSMLFKVFLESLTSGGAWQVGYLQAVPYYEPECRDREVVRNLVQTITGKLIELAQYDEASPYYVAPFMVEGNKFGCIRDAEFLWKSRILKSNTLIRENEQRINTIYASLANMSLLEITELAELARSLGKESDGNMGRLSDIDDRDVEIDSLLGFAQTYLSYCVGIMLGRWDVRYAASKAQPPELPDPFDPLPVCPPGMLQGPDSLQATPAAVPMDYPIHIEWDGILVDDREHADDVVRRFRDVLEVIWKDHSETIENEACEILGVRELRDYFRKPGNGGFWMDHVKRYSKSRRKAPIYWYLRSAKGNYGLWLYYHRLDKDILFKALLNYVEPRVRLEEERLKEFRTSKQAAGTAGREAKQIENDIDSQEQFVSELQDFSEKLRRAADLHLDPDLNDGVVLNIAPLWELVPWKEAKNYWEDLLEGKYEWSSIGKQLREKGLVK